MSLIEKLEVNSGYYHIDHNMFREAYLKGDENELFTLVFNSTPNNIQEVKNVEKYYNFHQKYPGNKPDFLTFILNNSYLNNWSNTSEDGFRASWIDDKKFEEFWGIPFNDKIAPIFQLIYQLDDKSRETLFQRIEWNSPIKTAIFNEISNKNFFTPYMTETGDSVLAESEVNFCDHVLLHFLKKKQYQEAINFFPFFQESYSSVLQSFTHTKLITDLKVINLYSYSESLDKSPEKKDDLIHCNSLLELLKVKALEAPELLGITCSINYQYRHQVFEDWINNFTTHFTKSFQVPHNKEHAQSFITFCKFVKSNLEDSTKGFTDANFLKLTYLLLESPDTSLASKFIKEIKGISLSKFLNQNIHLSDSLPLIYHHTHQDVAQLFYKVDPSILFSIPESSSPSSSSSFMYNIYEAYKESIEIYNQEAYEYNNELDLKDDVDFSEHKEIKNRKIGIDFLKTFLDENITANDLYSYLFMKPIFTSIKEKGYVSNIHYLLNTTLENPLGTIIDEVFHEKHPKLFKINIDEISIQDTLETIKEVESILEKTLFLPTTEHSLKVFLSKKRNNDSDTNLETEFSDEEQMLTLFAYQTGKYFTPLTTNSNSYPFNGANFLSRLYPTYIQLLQKVVDSDLSDDTKNNILDKYAPNILNFMKNSLAANTVYNSLYANSLNDQKYIDFIDKSINFLTTCGSYSKEEITDCFQQMKKTHTYNAYYGDYDSIGQHYYYLNSDALKMTGESMKKVFINLEQHLLELHVPEIEDSATASIKKLKF